MRNTGPLREPQSILFKHWRHATSDTMVGKHPNHLFPSKTIPKFEAFPRNRIFSALPHSPTALPHTPTWDVEPKFDFGIFKIISHLVRSIAGSRYESRTKDHTMGRSWSSRNRSYLLGFGNLMDVTFFVHTNPPTLKALWILYLVSN